MVREQEIRDGEVAIEAPPAFLMRPQMSSAAGRVSAPIRTM